MPLIKARHRPFYIWFLRIYARLMMHRQFHDTRFHGSFHDKGAPVLMIGNHFSWWDGFIANEINHRYIKKRFHVMMLEEQLEKRMFLNKAGAYSIRRSIAGTKESLDYTVGLLKNDQNMVVIYPQGAFQSLSKFPVNFEKGADHILSRMPSPVQVVFYAALIDYFTNRKPSLDIYFRQVDPAIVSTGSGIEAHYNGFLRECIDQQMPSP